MADVAYRFPVIGPIHLGLLYWQGDEDFPPEGTLLFNGFNNEKVSLDIVYALLCFACKRIAGI